MVAGEKPTCGMQPAEATEATEETIVLSENMTLSRGGVEGGLGDWDPLALGPAVGLAAGSGAFFSLSRADFLGNTCSVLFSFYVRPSSNLGLRTTV